MRLFGISICFNSKQLANTEESICFILLENLIFFKLVQSLKARLEMFTTLSGITISSKLSH